MRSPFLKSSTERNSRIESIRIAGLKVFGLKVSVNPIQAGVMHFPQ